MKNKYAIVVIMVLLLSGCTTALTDNTQFVSPLSTFPISTVPTPTITSVPKTPTPIAIATPLPSKSTIVGQVVSTATIKAQPLSQTVVKLAEVVWDAEKKDGIFVVDGASSPSTITDEQGKFLFANIKPGQYVIVVGELTGINEIVAESNDSNKAKIFTVESDKILDVKEIEVKLKY